MKPKAGQQQLKRLAPVGEHEVLSSQPAARPEDDEPVVLRIDDEPENANWLRRVRSWNRRPDEEGIKTV